MAQTLVIHLISQNASAIVQPRQKGSLLLSPKTTERFFVLSLSLSLSITYLSIYLSIGKQFIVVNICVRKFIVHKSYFSMAVIKSSTEATYGRKALFLLMI